MASSAKTPSLPHLEEGEIALLDLAADDARDVVSLSDKEALILQLHHRAQEQKLEKALLEQGMFLKMKPKKKMPILMSCLNRTRDAFRRKCRRTTSDSRTRASRSPSHIHRQEESSGNSSHDRTKPQSCSSESHFAS